MNRELDLFGVFVPDLLVWCVLAYLIGIPVRRLLSWLGIDALVWHRPLFDTALYVLILGGTVALSHRVLA